MTVDKMGRLAALCLLISLFPACRQAEQELAPAVPATFFPSSDVCTYPTKAPGNVFKRLGGGSWAPVDPAAPVPSYFCSGANETVQLYGDENSSVDVGYVVGGSKDGASTIELTYTAQGSGPIPNESTNRNVFTTLAETISREAMGAAPPGLFRKKLMNLNSFYKIGKAGAENFDVGSGFMLLTREASPDSNQVKVSVKFFSDIAFKLKD